MKMMALLEDTVIATNHLQIEMKDFDKVELVIRHGSKIQSIIVNLDELKLAVRKLTAK